MRTFATVGALVLIVPLAGCVAQVPEPMPLDLTNSAELEFVKGHESSGLGHAGGEYYTVCATPACTERRFFVSLTWINPDSVVRRVHAGEVYVSANTLNARGMTQAICTFKVEFNVDAGHAYTVQIFNRFGAKACYFGVRDKATGAPVHVSGVSEENGHKPVE
jgi:hypothetical protein